ncbi:MAG: hypothetical protein IJO19_00100 [Clostridia bacterium]|nr:hypothetical protein [Clostridia bacterium]
MLKQKTNTKYLNIIGTVAVLIVFAVVCRMIARYTDNVFLDKLLNFIRIFIYIGLLWAWGIAVSRRVIQFQVKNTLSAVAALMVFWLTVREFKFHLVIDLNLLRWLWYAYYIPILTIPLLALFVSMSLGKPENYNLPKWSALLYIPTIILILLVLTNDFHQLVFDFPKSGVWTEHSYKYGIVYFIVFGWSLVCSFAAFFTMLIKSRIPQSRKYFLLELLPFAAAIVYSVLYSIGQSFIKGVLGDVTVVFCIVFTSFFEICIQSGLIQSNTRYYDLFNALVDMSVQIFDNDYNVRYFSENSQPITKTNIICAKEKPIILNSKIRLNNMPINGGYAVWTEDISDLISAREKLDDLQDELRERNALLQYEYEKEREYKVTAQQNKLYDILQNKTQSQLDKIDVLVKNYQSTSSIEKKNAILAEILVLGSYIKRRKNFVLSTDIKSFIPKSMLESAFAESFRSLKLLGIGGGVLVQTEDFVKSNIIIPAYDFFETVLEETLSDLHYINVRVAKINNLLRISILTDFEKERKFNNIESQFQNTKIFYEDGTSFILNLESGDEYD